MKPEDASSDCWCGAYHELKCPVAKRLRGSWCTPRWLADLIDWVDLDPCASPRSVVTASDYCLLEWDDDGLYGDVPGGHLVAGDVKWATEPTSVFINPPYGRGEVIKWVRHYRHTRFIFLLRWDPSTDWFAELYPHCTHVWFPNRRIDFVPPPRIRDSSNPFPHALFLRNPDPGLRASLAGAGYTLDTGTAAGVDLGDAGSQRDDRGDGGGAGGGGTPEAGGAVGGWWDLGCYFCGADGSAGHAADCRSLRTPEGHPGDPPGSQGPRQRP